MTTITVSTQFGAGGHLVAEAVSKRLGFAYVNEEMVEFVANKANVSRAKNKCTVYFTLREKRRNRRKEKGNPARFSDAALFTGRFQIFSFDFAVARFCSASLPKTSSYGPAGTIMECSG
jgi:hypothetical protein